MLTRARALVNNMEAGAPDKVVYEAAATCLPVVVSNPVFDELTDGLGVDLMFPRADPAALAERIRSLAAMSPEARAAVVKRATDRVAAHHSVAHWAEGILEVAAR